MAVANTYTEPTTGTALNTARGYVNDSMRAILTNFKGPVVPSQLTADGVTIGEQDGMLYRSSITNALYISDSTNKQNNNIGGGFTRYGIGHRIEPSLTGLTANAALYEKGELVVTLDTGKLYVKNANANIIGSFYDVGNPTGYSVQGPYNNVNFTGQNVTVIRLLATSNVGINNGSPAAELDVVGNTFISGTANINSLVPTSVTTPAIDFVGPSWTVLGPSFASRSRRYVDNTSTSNVIRATRQSVSFLTPTFDAIAGTNVHVTDGSTIYIQGAPVGTTTNLIIDNSHAIHVAAGRTYLASAGSASTPVLAISTANTGLYSAGAGMLNVTTNGTLVATFDSVGNFTASGEITAFSDKRLKTNIRTIDNALSKISSIRGVYFDKNRKASLGVIAQEVEKIIPEVVIDGEYKSVAYGNLVGILIEAIKELKAKIEILENK